MAIPVRRRVARIPHWGTRRRAIRGSPSSELSRFVSSLRLLGAHRSCSAGGRSHTAIPRRGAVADSLGHRAELAREPFRSGGSSPPEPNGVADRPWGRRLLPTGEPAVGVWIRVGSRGRRAVPRSHDCRLVRAVPGCTSTNRHGGDVRRSTHVEPIRIPASGEGHDPRCGRWVARSRTRHSRGTGSCARVPRDVRSDQPLRGERNASLERERARRGSGLGQSQWPLSGSRTRSGQPHLDPAQFRLRW